VNTVGSVRQLAPRCWKLVLRSCAARSALLCGDCCCCCCCSSCCLAAMGGIEDDGFLDDLGFDTELEGFLSGEPSAIAAAAAAVGAVNLMPMPTFLGASTQESSTRAAAAPASSAGRLQGTLGGGAIGGAMGKIASAAMPAAVKETAGRFLQNAQPWRDFFLPVSVPAAADWCSRLTANLHLFQTNYAILFVVSLVFGILLEPSALVSVAIVAVVWAGFLKKYDDPDWTPAVGGVQLGPTQRWLLLAAATVIVLLFGAGSALLHTAFVYVLLAVVHGVCHDPAAKGIPSSSAPSAFGSPDVPL